MSRRDPAAVTRDHGPTDDRRCLRARSTLVGGLLVALLATACTPPEQPAPSPTSASVAASCETLPALIVDAVQDYVDSFADTVVAGVGGAVTARQGDFAATTADLRAEGEALGCDPDDLATGIRTELERLEGGTPVQDAVAATFRAGPLGTADPSDLGPIQATVGTSEELTAVVAVAGTGSVIRLAAGEYQLTQPLVLLRPLTLVGSDAGSTILTSTAPEGALILATDGDAAVRDLTIRHSGGGVLVAAGGYVLERLGISATNATAGTGVTLRPAANPLLPTGTRREVTGVEVTGGATGGIVVAGDAAPALQDVTVRDTAGCGLCFLEQAAGTVDGATVTGSEVGLRVDDAAAPTVTGLDVAASGVGIAFTGTGSPRVTGGRVAGTATGIQVTGSGAGTVSGTAVADATDVAVRVSGAARVSLVDLSLTGASTVGIAIVGEAVPTIRGGRIATTGEVGAIWAESGAGSATGLVVSGPALGLQVGDDAAPTLADVTVEAAGRAALLANGRSGGTVTGLACPAGEAGIAAFAEASTLTLTGQSGCQVVDER